MKWLRSWKAHILIFFAVVGPGFITANVDNEAGGIYTYSLAGAKYGYDLLWTLIPMTVALVVIQEMAARMGAVTGKGLSDLIREEFGLRATFLIMTGLVLANFTNVVAEFAGVAASLQIFGLSRYVSVPVGAVLVWFLIVKGDYKSVEKVFLVASTFYVAYLVSGVLAKPNWPEAAFRLVDPVVHRNNDYLVMVVGMIGATIAPWMQFYLQAAVVEKGVTAKQYGESRVEVVVGAIFAVVVVFFITVACAATLYAHGVRDITDAAQAAAALRPLAGEYAGLLFAFGLFNASLFAASILPLSTAYSVCEGLGLESGVNKKFSEAPFFYWLYTLLIVLGAAAVLWPKLPLVKVMVLSQVANGILLPFVLIFMLLLINRRDLMGEFVNSRTYNLVAWTTTIVMIVLTVILAGTSVLGIG
jgi:NRAMP (natural resistance-associated macrophage protein)-like metal ion transporter